MIPLILASFFAQRAVAQEFVIFPSKGQSQEQLEKDKFECYSWAKKESGFDPMAMPTATEAPPPKSDKSTAGTVAKGGLGGAAVGAGIGAVTGGGWSGAGKGAAIGGIAGGLLGGVKGSSDKKKEAAAEKQWEEEQTSQYMQKRTSYNRAYTACLEGKGYVVK
jgi:outer membrane lipoprotein SlyB